MNTSHSILAVLHRIACCVPTWSWPQPGTWRSRYGRDDGIDMTATLYLPPGYDKDKDGPLPCLIWAYPREFKSKDAAGIHSLTGYFVIV